MSGREGRQFGCCWALNKKRFNVNFKFKSHQDSLLLQLRFDGSAGLTACRVALMAIIPRWIANITCGHKAKKMMQNVWKQRRVNGAPSSVNMSHTVHQDSTEESELLRQHCYPSTNKWKVSPEKRSKMKCLNLSPQQKNDCVIKIKFSKLFLLV